MIDIKLHFSSGDKEFLQDLYTLDRMSLKHFQSLLRYEKMGRHTLRDRVT